MKMINDKKKKMDLFVWLTNEMKNVATMSVKKKIRGQRSKPATTKCSIKIADR